QKSSELLKPKWSPGNTADSVHFAARELVDVLDVDDIAIIDVVADRSDFRRIDLKKPLLPLSWVSLGGNVLATNSIPILCQGPHSSFHRTAILQGYDASHFSPHQFRSEESSADHLGLSI